MTRNDWTYIKRRDALKRHAQRTNQPCWLCGRPINWQAHWKAPDSFTADHVQAIAAGGHMHGQLKPAHRSCNSARGKKPPHEYTPPPTGDTPTAYQW